MAETLVVFALLLVTVGLFYGGRSMRRSEQSSAKFGSIIGQHPRFFGGLLLVTAALMVALGLFALTVA